MKRLIIPLLALAFTSIAPNLAASLTSAEARTEAASSQDMIVRTAINEGTAYTSHALVDYQVVHGKYDGTMSTFTTYDFDASSWTGSLGASTDNAYCSHWKLCSQSDDGIIFKITAKEAVNVTIEKTTIGGDWVSDATLRIGKQSGENITSLSSLTLTASTEASAYGGSFDLAKDDILYYEFKFQWTSHRNMINLPSYTFTEILEGGIHLFLLFLLPVTIQHGKEVLKIQHLKEAVILNHPAKIQVLLKNLQVLKK